MMLQYHAPSYSSYLRLQLSIGDIAVVCRLKWLKRGALDAVPVTILDDYPLLSALYDRVLSEPSIVAYEAKLATK